MRTLSQLLMDFQTALPPEKVSIEDILERLHERGIGFLLFVFALPAALPVPLPGVKFFMGLPLLLLTVQQAMGRHTVWVPEKVKRQSFSRSHVENILTASLPYIAFLERFVRPRLEFVTQGVFSRIVGLAGLIMAISVFIPLPLTNTVPSMGIAVMSLGVSMRDGLTVLFGMAFGLAWVVMIFSLFAFLGLEGLDLVKETIKSFL